MHAHHGVDLRLLGYFFFQNFDFRVHAQHFNLIFGQVGIFINFNVRRFVNVDLPDADFLFQGVVNGVGQDLKPVVPLKDVGGIVGFLFGFLHRLRLARDKLDRAPGLQEHPHQRWLDGPHGIAALCCHDF